MAAIPVAVTFGSEAKVLPYERALREAGLEPVRVRQAGLPRGVRGLLLTGGTDVNPALYGQVPHSQSHEPDDERDEIELGTLAEARLAEIPVLAICRGMQMLNVALGGTLHQHLESEFVHRVLPPPETAGGEHPAVHHIAVREGTRLAGIVGAGEHQVNSRHHQAVAALGQSLRISAIAADEVIEAVEMPGNPFVVGVQWHPEDRVRVSEMDRKLFEAFAGAVRQF